MNRRIALAASAAAVVVGLVLLIAPVSAAPATRIVDSGWWWRVQTGAVTQLPPPPNVEPGMLQVQGAPDRAQAIAAISAELPDDQVSPTLTLRVAPGGDQGGAAAVLLACNAGSGWTGEDAGRWDSAPVVDCSTSVTGIRSEDGNTWTFPLGPLQFEDKFNIILTPGTVDGAPDGLNGSSFTLVFEEPTAADIATTGGQAPPADLPAFTPPPPPASSGSDAPAPPAFDSGFTPAPAPIEQPAPVLGAQPSLEPELQGSTLTAPERQAGNEPVLAAASVPEPRTVARVLGVLVVLAGIAGAFTVLRTDLLAGAAATGEHPVAGGLGRFARERTSEPNAIS